MLEAGADIIETNTFSSTSIAQADYDATDVVYRVVTFHIKNLPTFSYSKYQIFFQFMPFFCFMCSLYQLA